MQRVHIYYIYMPTPFAPFPHLCAGCSLHQFCTNFALILKIRINMAKSIFKTEVSFLSSITCKDSEILKLKLTDILLSGRWKEQVSAIRNESDSGKRKAMKQHLPAFIPSGVFSTKKAEGLVAHSCYICIDIDHKDNQGVTNFQFLKEAISDNPNVAYCGLSVSGGGYFCLIPIADPAKHRDYFRSLEHDFKLCGIRIDRQCVNVNRLRYVSYDPDPYINTAAIPYDYVLPSEEEPGRAVDKVLMRQVTPTEARTQFDKVLKEIQSSSTDITGDYGQWFEILCAIASTYGEEGREAAHTVSAMADAYNYGETDGQYSECLKHGGYGYTIGTFFYYAKRELGAHKFDLVTKGGEI